MHRPSETRASTADAHSVSICCSALEYCSALIWVEANAARGTIEAQSYSPILANLRKASPWHIIHISNFTLFAIRFENTQENPQSLRVGIMYTAQQKWISTQKMGHSFKGDLFMPSSDAYQEADRLYQMQKIYEEPGQRLRTGEIGEKLGVSEDTVIRYIGALASTGRLVLEKQGKYRMQRRTHLHTQPLSC